MMKYFFLLLIILSCATKIDSERTEILSNTFAKEEVTNIEISYR